jgi:hypothetical protein
MTHLNPNKVLSRAESSYSKMDEFYFQIMENPISSKVEKGSVSA